MRGFALFFILLLSLTLVSSLTPEFDCPSEVFVGEEFSCDLKIKENGGMYDIKVEVMMDGKTVGKIWSYEKGDWQSAYYYLNEFISLGEQKKVKLLLEGVPEVKNLKVRQGTKIDAYEFNLTVKEATPEAPEPEEQILETTDESSEETSERELVKEPVMQEEEAEELEDISVISLNADAPSPELVYESKESVVIRYLPWALGVLVLILIILHFWEKF